LGRGLEPRPHAVRLAQDGGANPRKARWLLRGNQPRKLSASIRQDTRPLWPKGRAHRVSSSGHFWPADQRASCYRYIPFEVSGQWRSVTLRLSYQRSIGSWMSAFFSPEGNTTEAIGLPSLGRNGTWAPTRPGSASARTSVSGSTSPEEHYVFAREGLDLLNGGVPYSHRTARRLRDAPERPPPARCRCSARRHGQDEVTASERATSTVQLSLCAPDCAVRLCLFASSLGPA
jgi:hypothetical protein